MFMILAAKAADEIQPKLGLDIAAVFRPGARERRERHQQGDDEQGQDEERGGALHRSGQ